MIGLYARIPHIRISKANIRRENPSKEKEKVASEYSLLVHFAFTDNNNDMINIEIHIFFIPKMPTFIAIQVLSQQTEMLIHPLHVFSILSIKRESAAFIIFVNFSPLFRGST
jgi:hypothetical protein